ncbi:hypothetical protein ACQEUU_17690 [Nonomuraea sp. CA-218870]|uniref:hypothetical protein n=1 Tax=Nonomuraea sp. CA-218870 TaxID=3239998 RepID=UPI003D8FB250
MSAPRIFPCLLALAALTVGTACSSAPPITGGEPRASGVAGDGAASSADPATPATPEPTALTAEAYKSELGGRHDDMSKAIKSLAGARSLKVLDQRVVKAQETLQGTADELAALSPPAEIQPQHQAYVESLREVALRLGTSATRVGTGNLCTPGAVFTDLDDSLAALDRAGEALEDAGDYKADIVSVKAANKQNRRLRNGQWLRQGAGGGRSSLQIHNGGTRDAVVSLVRGKSKVYSVYVRKKGKFKISGVSDGNYRIYFTHGVDWDGKSGAFTRECSFERFQKPVKFKTTYTATQILWHDWRITLHAITGGNAPTSKVDPDDFPA